MADHADQSACGVPQGYVLSAILFLLYCDDPQLIIESHGLCPHLYADDSQIYGSCQPSAIPKLQTRISACINDVAGWMRSSRLQLNSSKTEVIVVDYTNCHVPRFESALTSWFRLPSFEISEFLLILMSRCGPTSHDLC